MRVSPVDREFLGWTTRHDEVSVGSPLTIGVIVYAEMIMRTAGPITTVDVRQAVTSASSTVDALPRRVWRLAPSVAL